MEHFVRTALVITLKDFKRRIKDPLTLICLMTFPLLLALIIGMAFGPQVRMAMPETELLICDHDNGLLSGMLKMAFQQGGAGAPRINIKEVEEDAGRQAIMDNETSALLIIPGSFTDDFFEGRPVALTLLKNPSQSILPEVAEQYTHALTMLGSFASRFFQKELSAIKANALSQGAGIRLDWTLLGPALRDKLNTVEKYLFPVPISIVERKAGQENAAKKEKETQPPGRAQKGGGTSSRPEARAEKKERSINKARPINIYEYILPGLAIFGIFFVAQTIFRDIFTEQIQGTLPRLMTAPVTVESFLLGKAASALLISFLALVLMQFVGWILFDVHWGPLHLLLLIDAVAILGISGLCLLIFSLARTQTQGEAILSAVFIFMGLFGGSFMPLRTLPPGFRTVTRFTINGHIIDAHNQLIFSGEHWKILPSLAIVLLIGLICSVAGWMLLRRKIRRGI